MIERLALFDFDGTLTRGDTLLPFLKWTAGPVRFTRALAITSPWLAGYTLRLVRNDVVKQKLLSRALGGMAAEDLRAQGESFARQVIPDMLREDTMKKLKQHQNDGYTCVLVSASLDLYLAPWAKKVGFSGLLCSRLFFDDTGRANGALYGDNCFGEEKVRRIDAWLAERGGRPPCIVAYGDTPGDRHMLSMAHEAFWV